MLSIALSIQYVAKQIRLLESPAQALQILDLSRYRYKA